MRKKRRIAKPCTGAALAVWMLNGMTKPLIRKNTATPMRPMSMRETKSLSQYPSAAVTGLSA